MLVVKVHYRPKKGIDGSLADTSAVRQYIVSYEILPISLVNLQHRYPHDHENELTRFAYISRTI